MFWSDKAKISKHLESIDKNNWSAFDILLNQYLDGTLKNRLNEAGITEAEICIDFLDRYKCIGIQGKHDRYFVDLQIDEEEFSIACDPDEPDDGRFFPLESPEMLYATVSAEISSLDD